MTEMPRATVRQCAILVGGLGSRLGALTASLPKPLMRCGDRPFLAWLMRELQRFGVEEFLLLAGHLSDEIEGAVDEIRRFLPRPARIEITVEPFRAGTGGALHHARDRLDRRFLLSNGDSLFATNLAALLAAGATAPGGWMMLRAVADLDRYGEVRLAAEGHVSAFLPSAGGTARGAGLINSGLYLFDESLMPHLRPECSLEQDVLPAMAAAGQLRGVVGEGYFRDIGLPGDLDAAGQELPRVLRRRALFLDRDGVLNHDEGWVGTRERFRWIEGAREAVRAANDAGAHVFMVTNQSGIARGFYSADDLRALTAWMTDALHADGATLDDWRYSPYHPDAAVEAYRRASPCRKPGPGMILDLMRTWGLRPEDCALLGDQPTDVQAAEAAGIAGTLLRPGDDLRVAVQHFLEAA